MTKTATPAAAAATIARAVAAARAPGISPRCRGDTWRKVASGVPRNGDATATTAMTAAEARRKGWRAYGTRTGHSQLYDAMSTAASRSGDCEGGAHVRVASNGARGRGSTGYGFACAESVACASLPPRSLINSAPARSPRARGVRTAFRGKGNTAPTLPQYEDYTSAPAWARYGSITAFRGKGNPAPILPRDEDYTKQLNKTNKQILSCQGFRPLLNVIDQLHQNFKPKNVATACYRLAKMMGDDGRDVHP